MPLNIGHEEGFRSYHRLSLGCLYGDFAPSSRDHHYFNVGAFTRDGKRLRLREGILFLTRGICRNETITNSNELGVAWW
jgi:hypothetical protein